MAGRVFVVASGKGGVGKTTTVLNLGVTLRGNDHSVALVDADLGMANLATLLQIDHDPTLHDVLSGEADVDDALVEPVPRFGVVPGSRELAKYADADPGVLRDVIKTLKEEYEYVLIDAGAGLNHEDVLPLALADEVILLTTPEEVAIGDTRKIAEFAGLVDRDITGVVINRVHQEIDAESIADQMETDPLAVIPEDPAIRESNAVGTPVERYAPNSPGAAAFRRLAAVLTGETISSLNVPAVGNDVTASQEYESAEARESPGLLARLVALFR